MCCHLFGEGIEASFGSLLLEGLSMDYGRESNPQCGFRTQVWRTLVDQYNTFGH
jgi:hypothetical protein